MGSQPEFEHPKKAFGWAARDQSGLLSPFNFSRRETNEKDVAFKILYCGICHSDLHMMKNEWGIIIGGMRETQEMIDFAAKHNVKPSIEVISMDYVNTAMDRLLKSDVKYRFVIHVGNTLKPNSQVLHNC